jgi:hypothetical protein
MIFNLDAKEKRFFRPLTEEDIRSKLYGSAVGVSADTFSKPVKIKKASTQKAPEAEKKSDDETTKIYSELASLKSELEQAKRRLKKIKGISRQRIRIISVYILISFVILFFLALILKNTFFAKPKAQSASARVPASATQMRYTVQVAVSERLDDAERFKANLEAKGYKPFIHKSSSSAGKDRFTIYAGEFSEKDSAGRLTDDLRLKEGIKDSFVVNMPE